METGGWEIFMDKMKEKIKTEAMICTSMLTVVGWAVQEMSIAQLT